MSAVASEGAVVVNEAEIRVAVVDDHLLLRKMLGRFVDTRKDMTVLWEAENGQAAWELCRTGVPDVILMDISMPVMDGIVATRSITAEYTGLAVLIVSAYVDDDHVFEGIKAGARGYLHKDSSPDEVASAIRKIHSGESIMSADIAEKTLTALHPDKPKAQVEPRLTGREIEIIKAVAEGQSRKQIAGRLYISEHTVRNHVTRIYRKLHIFDRTQAALYAVRHGLVDPQLLPE